MKQNTPVVEAVTAAKMRHGSSRQNPALPLTSGIARSSRVPQNTGTISTISGSSLIAGEKTQTEVARDERISKPLGQPNDKKVL